MTKDAEEPAKGELPVAAQKALDQIIAGEALPRVDSGQGYFNVDAFEEHLVLDRRVTDLGNGEIERVFLVNGGGSYPYLRIAERLKYDQAAAEYFIAWQSTIVADHIVVKLRDGIPQEMLEQLNQRFGTTTLLDMGLANNYIVQLPKPSLDGVFDFSRLFEAENEWIERVHMDSVEAPTVTPNDPLWSSQWGKQRMDCPEAWETETGDTNVIVAVIDTGVDLDHPDLAAHIWRNPGEADALSTNGVDDDGNGYVDDWIGWDFGQDDNDPDDNGDVDYGGNFSAGSHGTHCSGIIGALGNNSTQVAGVCWNVTIMALKPFEYFSSSSDMRVYNTKAILAMKYATDNGAKVTSNSYGGFGDGSGYYDGVNYQNEGGVLFVAAAGNNTTDTDSSPYQPAVVDLPNVIAVASSDDTENLSWFSNYGSNSVDIVAAGSSILSTIPSGATGYKSGTSMATPQVAGAAALMYSYRPDLDYLGCKQVLMNGVDLFAAYAGTCISEGRMNVNSSLALLSGYPIISVNNTAPIMGAEAGLIDQITLNFSNVGTGDLAYVISDNTAAGYSWSDSDEAGGPSYSWIDISTTGTLVALTDDGESSLIPIGFDFPFYSSTYSQFQIGANGVVSFGAGAVGYNNAPLPSGAVPAQSVLPFWDDLDPGGAGTIRYHSTSERLVVCWLGVPRYGSTDYQTFQVVLYPTGRIVFQYQTLNGTLTSTTVGIQGDISGDSHIEMIYNGTYLKNNLAVEFTSAPEWLSSAPQNGTIPEGSSNAVVFTADATGLTEGSYTTKVVVAYNNPFNPQLQIAFIFSVGSSDSDGDGLPNWWETLHYGGPTNGDAFATCSNGVNTVLDAYIAGFDPTDPNAGFGVSGNWDALWWNSVSGRVYGVWWSSNLLYGFEPLQTNIPWSTGGFTDTVHSADAEGFYRIDVQLAP